MIGDCRKVLPTLAAESVDCCVTSDTKSRIIDGARQRIDEVRGGEKALAGWDNLTKEEQQAIGSNKRSVWTVATMPFRGAHFATFPPALVTPCVLAGCPAGGVVLDPFCGSGTTGAVALELGRSAVLIELNDEDYKGLIDQRLSTTIGLPL
jgi:hypothetical protein